MQPVDDGIHARHARRRLQRELLASDMIDLTFHREFAIGEGEMDWPFGRMDARFAVQGTAHRVEHGLLVGHRIVSFGQAGSGIAGGCLPVAPRGKHAHSPARCRIARPMSS